MKTLKTFFIIVLVIASVAIIGATTLMDPKTGAGTSYGQDANAFGTSAYKGKDIMLNKVTTIFSIIFVISLIGLVVVK